ncbi:hypothetical protein C9374_006105 [Naegleria lovaniensis]|uniref:CCDC113/CCDC96 coiled-coil domain-containing protein n=1 Tax=Naegleria lovaniensis TaxID=51637 RepID=A0AA88GIQ8_NAELO|nr:uncharacterized protein C9374_006105 [Naegleria lovaniensis]KAG2381721.1 hypothetical protein C9374_006105 [Naegleria lovaniensis]
MIHLRIHQGSFHTEIEDSDDDEETREYKTLLKRKSKYIERYTEEIKRREVIYAKHRKAQKRLSEIFKVTKSSERFNSTTVPSSEIEERYAKYVAEHKELRDEMEELRKKNAYQLNEMRIRLEERETNAEELQNSFREFKRSMALSAVDSRTGKKIPKTSINKYIEKDEQKDGHIREIRTTYIELKNSKESLEKLIKSREEFSEGLHLMDYEQLKMENSTLMEKLREKRDSLKKAREKQTTTVHILTHVKEKLQYVQTENSDLQRKLEKLNEEMTDHKDMLTRIKKDRDALKKQNLDMREKEPLVGNDSLLLDFQSRKDELEQLKEQVVDLKNTYHKLILKTKSYNKQAEAFERKVVPKPTITLPELNKRLY